MCPIGDNSEEAKNDFDNRIEKKPTDVETMDPTIEAENPVFSAHCTPARAQIGGFGRRGFESGCCRKSASVHFMFVLCR